MEHPPLIESLPPEILAQVFHFLDHPAPSDEQLHDQPHADMLRRPDDSILKTVSHVNKRWRATVLPLLFHNVVWYLDRFDLMKVEEQQFKSTSPAGATVTTAIPVFPFLVDNNLTSYVKSFTLIITSASSSPRGSTSGSTSADVGLYRRGDGSGHYGYLSTPLSPHSSGARDLVFNEDTNWLWKLILDVVDPLRFTIIASPCMLASLLARMLFLGDAWSFDQSHHVLSLSRGDDARRRRTLARSQGAATETTTTAQLQAPPSSPRPSSSSSSNSSLARPAKCIPCDLFTLSSSSSFPAHPWTALLLNEGSSTRVYKTYEYFHKRPPSMLGALLGVEEFPNDLPLLPPTITDLSYVGIFPLASHVHTLVQHLPPLRRLFVQLVPRNDILNDRKEMEHLDMDDLWAERNRAYQGILPKLFGDGNTAWGGGGGGVNNDNHWNATAAATDLGNWKQLQVFETGDTLDLGAWELAFEYASEESAEWSMERVGRFVRRRQPQQELELS